MRNVRVHIKSFLWITPFITFMGGYLLVQSYFGTPTVEVPSLVGKQLHEAVCLLSEHSLAPRIIAEKEDTDLPAGTILTQKPDPGTRTRSHQAVMLIISKAPAPLTTPLIVGQRIDAIMPDLKARGMRVKIYDLEANVPRGTCLAQSPPAYQKADPNSTMILYRAITKPKPCIMPNMCGKTVTRVQELCEQLPITCQVIHSRQPVAGHTCEQCVVIDQRPLPGTLVTFNHKKPLLVQIQT